MGPWWLKVGRELSLTQGAAVFVRHDDRLRDERPLAVAVAVNEISRRVFFLRDGFEIFVDDIAAVRRVHPADAVVEALVNEELSPRHRAVGREPFVADDVHFRPKINVVCGLMSSSA